MTTLPSDEAKEHLARLIQDVTESHVPIQIVDQSRKAVLIAEDDWRAIQETLYLVSIPGMRESILEGMKTPLEECDEDPGW